MRKPASRTTSEANCWSGEGSRMGFELALSCLGGRNPARRETFRMRGAVIWTWDPGLMGHCGPEASCARGVKQMLPKERAGMLLAWGMQRDLFLLYIAYWIRLPAIHGIFHSTRQCETAFKREEIAQGEEPLCSPPCLLQNGQGTCVSSALENRAGADSSPAQIALN